MKKLLTLSFFVLAGALSVQAQNIIRGPYLQSPNWNSIKVAWRTETESLSLVKYGTSPSNLTNTAATSGMAINHVVELTGLEAYTTYFYAISDSVGTLIEGGDSLHRFKTWPMP